MQGLVVLALLHVMLQLLPLLLHLLEQCRCISDLQLAECICACRPTLLELHVEISCLMWGALGVLNQRGMWVCGVNCCCCIHVCVCVCSPAEVPHMLLQLSTCCPLTPQFLGDKMIVQDRQESKDWCAVFFESAAGSSTLQGASGRCHLAQKCKYIVVCVGFWCVQHQRSAGNAVEGQSRLQSPNIAVKHRANCRCFCKRRATSRL